MPAPRRRRVLLLLSNVNFNSNGIGRHVRLGIVVGSVLLFFQARIATLSSFLVPPAVVETQEEPLSTVQQQQQQQQQSRPNDSQHAVDDVPFPDGIAEKVASLHLARTWPIKPYSYSNSNDGNGGGDRSGGWCYLDDHKGIKKDEEEEEGRGGGGGGGLLLAKVPKSASSTVAGVALRIWRNRNCTRPLQWRHGRAYDLRYAEQRDPVASFLLAPIRLPHSRALSSVFFHSVSFHRKQSAQKAVSDQFVLDKLRRDIPSNFITDYATLLGPDDDEDGDPRGEGTNDDKAAASDRNDDRRQRGRRAIERHVESILEGYDFLIVVERLDESLAVLSHLTKLPLEDFVTLSSKQSGQWYLTGNTPQSRRCISLAKPVLTRAVRDYFTSDDDATDAGADESGGDASTPSSSWLDRQYGDYLLWAAANKSLDLTIQSIGPDVVQSNVDRLRRMHDTIQRECPVVSDSVAPASPNVFDYEHQVLLPCSTDGKPQFEISRPNCYERDFGCGYPCVDRVFADLV